MRSWYLFELLHTSLSKLIISHATVKTNQNVIKLGSLLFWWLILKPVLCTSLTVKNSEYFLKSESFGKLWRWRALIFSQNERKGLLCKNINILLTYREVRISLKYGTVHPLWKLLKINWKVDVCRNLYGQQGYLFVKLKKIVRPVV